MKKMGSKKTRSASQKKSPAVLTSGQEAMISAAKAMSGAKRRAEQVLEKKQ